jgi:hypothetical protein
VLLAVPRLSNGQAQGFHPRQQGTQNSGWCLLSSKQQNVQCSAACLHIDASLHPACQWVRPGFLLSGVARPTGRHSQTFGAWYAVVVVAACFACSARFELHCENVRSARACSCRDVPVAALLR